MPRPLSQSRRHRGFGLSSPAANWRPRVSSPLTSEVHFTDYDEKASTEKQWIMLDTSSHAAEELPVRRAGVFQIGFSLMIDCLMSIWLGQVTLDNLFTLRYLLSAIPSPFNQPGTVLFCNLNDRFLNTRDYPVLSSGQSLATLTELPWNCNFLPRLIVNVGQSQHLANLVPLIVACIVTLKLAFGFLILRTSNSPTAPTTYLKVTVLFHLLLSYVAFVYTHLHIDLLPHRHPNVDKLLGVCSEGIFFLVGVIVCLCVLSLVVVPLLWIGSKLGQPNERGLSTANSNSTNNLEAHHYKHAQNGGYLSALSKQKKRALASRF